MSARGVRLDRAVERWLEAELEGAVEAAERALLAAFGLLPAPLARVDLVAATLSRLPAAAATPSRLFKLAVGLPLLLSGLAMVLLPSLLRGWVDRNRMIDLLAGVLASASERLAAGLTLWGVLEALGGAVTAAASSPVTLALLSAGLALAIAAFNLLDGLLPAAGGARRA